MSGRINWEGVNCSNEFKDLIGQLLEREPHRRLGYTGGGEAVLMHAWFPPENIRKKIEARTIPVPIRPEDAEKRQISINEQFFDAFKW